MGWRAPRTSLDAVSVCLHWSAPESCRNFGYAIKSHRFNFVYYRYTTTFCFAKRWSQKATTIKVAARLAQARMHKATETGAPLPTGRQAR